MEAFKSGEFCFIGEVYPDQAVYRTNAIRNLHFPIKADAVMPAVEIFPVYGGADGVAIKQAVDRDVKGIVIEALGMGNMNVPMLDAAKYAMSKGVSVAITTRVNSGRVMLSYGFEGGGKTSYEAGAVMGEDYRTPKARILLTLALNAGITDRDELQKLFD